MISTRKKRQQNRRVRSQIDNSNQDIIFGDAVSSWQQNFMVNNGSGDQEITGESNDGIITTIENTVNVQTLGKCFNGKIGRKLGNIVDTVEDRIQNANLNAIDNIITPRIELAVRSVNVSSGRDAASITANSERGERIGITASFENVSERSNTFHELNANDETRGTSQTKYVNCRSQEHFLTGNHTHHSCFKTADLS